MVKGNVSFDFADRVALVTGGGNGIGRATALNFARDGAKVVIGDVDAGGEETAADIKRAGGEAMFVLTDVREAGQVQNLVAKAAQRYGRLDYAFNNAGILPPGAALAEVDQEDFDRTIAVDLAGVFLCMKYELLQMVPAGGGVIINNASVAGMIAEVGMSPYVAAKHGVIGLTRAAAVEYAAHGVRINALAPGLVETRMTKGWFDNPEIRAHLMGNTPMGRPAQPEEIAGMVLFLCSDRASYATGAVYTVDGAYTAR